jgi:hypothetical protein
MIVIWAAADRPDLYAILSVLRPGMRRVSSILWELKSIQLPNCLVLLFYLDLFYLLLLNYVLACSSPPHQRPGVFGHTSSTRSESLLTLLSLSPSPPSSPSPSPYLFLFLFLALCLPPTPPPSSRLFFSLRLLSFTSCFLPSLSSLPPTM